MTLVSYSAFLASLLLIYLCGKNNNFFQECEQPLRARRHDHFETINQRKEVLLATWNSILEALSQEHFNDESCLFNTAALVIIIDLEGLLKFWDFSLKYFE